MRDQVSNAWIAIVLATVLSACSNSSGDDDTGSTAGTGAGKGGTGDGSGGKDASGTGGKTDSGSGGMAPGGSGSGGAMSGSGGMMSDGTGGCAAGTHPVTGTGGLDSNGMPMRGNGLGPDWQNYCDPTPATMGSMDRGQYLVDHVLICGVCHTPSNDRRRARHGMYLAGSRSYDFTDVDGTIITVNAENLTSTTPRVWRRGPTVRSAPRSPRASTTSTTRSTRSCRTPSTRC